MKILILIMLIPVQLLGQIDEVEVVFTSPDEMKVYKSKEEDLYYENGRDQEFRPQPVEVVKKHELRYIEILSTGINSSGKVNDATSEKINRDIEFLDPKNLTGESGKRKSLMSYANSNGTVATIFLDSKYDEFMWGEPGYWINLTDKSGSRDFYMGLAQNYYMKLLDAGENIWNNDSTLLINAVRVRLVEPFIHPVAAPKYETIDNVKVKILISDLTRDSDKDGLTDIEEDNMMLNPASQDTDGDGINDFDDHNPRFKSVTTNETLVYKVLLDNYIGDTVRIRNNRILGAKRPRLINMLKSRTRLIVTDDTNLQTVDYDYDRTIILSTSEYQMSKARYPVTFDETNISPLFKVDDLQDTFVVSVSNDLGGEKYFVKRLADGFDVVEIESWIH